MKERRTAVALLLIQLVIVLSIAGKYLYERKVCPRIWVRATQFDPELPLRGRYLALQLMTDACSLPRDHDHYLKGYVIDGKQQPGSWRWTVTIKEKGGRLVPQLEDHPKTPGKTESLELREDQPCDRAVLPSGVEYFIPDRAKSPFPLQAGEELWVEVTVPPSGPPRPIQLALASQAGFRPLRFE